MTTKKFKEFKKYSRVWLNPPNHYDTGALHWNVSACGSYVDADLTIWDCGRKVTLNFSFGNDKDAKLRANKIDLVIKELAKFKEALGEGLSFANTQGRFREDSVSEEIE